ncbi:hypothetical protein LCGC14_2595860, partial [marine sediment metagenome]
DWDLNWYAQGSDYYAFAKHASQEDPLVLTYFLQKEKIALMEISEKDSFRIFDYLSFIDVYCYIWNNETEAFDIRFTFTEDDFTIFTNGTVSWNVNITSMNVKDDQIIFKFYSSDYANIIKDSQKNGMFLKVLIPNIYSTHGTIDSLQIQFIDFDNNVFTYSMGSLDFDEYFKNAAQYKRIIPGLSELLEIPLYIDLAKLAVSNFETEFNITQIYSVNFVIVDAPVWPGSIEMYDPNTQTTIINFPYQIFGVSEIKFYDILANNSNLNVYFDDFEYDFIVAENSIEVIPFDNEILNLEVYKNIFPYPTELYQATYGFESEADGTTGLNIDFIDDYHNHANTYAKIVPEFNGHEKVLQMYDHSNYDIAWWSNHSAQAFGTYEFYMTTSDPTFASVVTVYTNGRGSNGLFALDFYGKIILRFKKIDRSLRPHNVRTEQQGQCTMQTLFDNATIVTAGYRVDVTETSIK